MSTALTSWKAALVAAGAVIALPATALAHPHVWVIATGELVYAAGALTGVRFAWEFDDMFSAFAIQGLDANNDGVYSREELAELATTNIESLKEFGYFTVATAGSRKITFTDPTDYHLEYRDNVLVLHFTLPVAKPQVTKSPLRLEVYDPTVLVAFAFAEAETPVALAGAPAGCAVAVERPKPLQPGQQFDISESFFNSLTSGSDFGLQFANRATVTCP
ncbi:DUF1007 family protein [Blastochloris viridis]|uniref:ABC-type uncharacterized transport system, periplasmic component n=1 Tax=Blastochloris viridis TaxID=1079 RepID=A0A0H5BBK1_BLAVI|nr:DUF1007 family protein [Blastochloris viridis]ALK08250.1 hypothetical protein BVIR_452 [Blastochloris viridis]BAR98484.1 hypothetical protein BV133_891 [Blastochloris viridis]CUU44172.1 ABC-type uncharacterized transport system, periplasmic component [Blastochloris viridis]